MRKATEASIAGLMLGLLMGASAGAGQSWPPRGFRDLRMRTETVPLDVSRLFPEETLTEIEFSDAFSTGSSRYQVIMLGSERARDNCGSAGCAYAILRLDAHFRPAGIAWGPQYAQAIAISADRRIIAVGEDKAGVDSTEFIRLHD